MEERLRAPCGVLSTVSVVSTVSAAIWSSSVGGDMLKLPLMS